MNTPFQKIAEALIAELYDQPKPATFEQIAASVCPQSCAAALQALGTEVAAVFVELGIDAKDISMRGTLAMWASHAAAEYDGRVPVVRLGPAL